MSEMQPKGLSEYETEILKKTISQTSTFWLIEDALYKNTGCSILRFADGEYRIIEDSRRYTGKFQAFGDSWNTDYGLLDLDIGFLAKQLIQAGNACTYLAPSISGIWWDIYAGWDHFDKRSMYVDNFFPYQIVDEQVRFLLNNAKGLIYISRDPRWSVAAKEKGLNSNIKHISLSSHLDIPGVIQELQYSEQQLVLFSGGPIGKILGPVIQNLNKVGLDVGSAIWRWC